MKAFHVCGHMTGTPNMGGSFVSYNRTLLDAMGANALPLPQHLLKCDHKCMLLATMGYFDNIILRHTCISGWDIP